MKQPRFSTRIKKFTKDIFSENTSVIFVSLSKEEFGIVKKVSNSFAPVFNYEKHEVVGKNCSFIMPKNIAIVHDNILWNFIQRGYVDYVKYNKILPLSILNRFGK